jgi:hypothetical protein
MSTPVYSEEIARLRAELAEAEVRVLQARLDALLVSSNSASASSTSGASIPGPLIVPKFRDSERRILQELVRTKGSGPLLVWFRLYDAKVNGKKHEIAALIEEDGTFGYKKKDESYLNGLHSFEVMWWIRSEYDLSGSVPYEELLADGRTFHCLKFAYLEGETRYSLLSTAHDILKELDSDKKSGYVTPPASPRPTHPSALKRKHYHKTGGGKASSSVASNSVASSSVASSRVASNSVASGSVASGSVASGSVASGSVASGSVASNRMASSPVTYISLRPPPGIQRKPETVILAGGSLKAPLSLSALYKPR